MKQRHLDFAKAGIVVAPFTGAWIETTGIQAHLQFGCVAPFTGAWIETANAEKISETPFGRTLHGCVD